MLTFEFNQCRKNILENNFNIILFNAYENDCPIADINIFIQNLDDHTEKFLECAYYNILIPNLEWIFQNSIKNIKKWVKLPLS